MTPSGDGFPGVAYSWGDKKPTSQVRNELRKSATTPHLCGQNWRDRRPGAAVGRRRLRRTARPAFNDQGRLIGIAMPGQSPGFQLLVPTTRLGDSSTDRRVREEAGAFKDMVSGP